MPQLIKIHPDGREEFKESEKRVQAIAWNEDGTFKEVIEKLDYPLGVIAFEKNNELIFQLNYAAELFNYNNIKNLLLAVRTLLEGIAINPYQETKSLKYLNKDQYNQIINVWNDTDKDYPDNKTIHQIFEEQVEKTPDSVAVVDDSIGIKYTYQELSENSEKLAKYILNYISKYEYRKRHLACYPFLL